MSESDIIFVLQIEYTLIVLDHDAKKPQLSLVGPKILQTLQRPETDDPDNHHTKWRPEYASYMIEGGYKKKTTCIYMCYFCVH